MTRWNGWPLERLLYLFLGLAFLVVWAQVYLFHGVMSGFHESPQYGPVIYTPLMIIAAFWYAATPQPLARASFLVLFSGGVLVGLIGVYLHAEGVAGMPGGWTMENIATGPPILLPAIYLAVSLLGVLIALWPLKLGAASRSSGRHRVPPGMPATGVRG